MPQLLRTLRFTIFVGSTAISATSFAGTILYVDDDAPPRGSGDSWGSPLRYLQDALAIAAKPESGVSEIRIGQGTYKADQGANQTPGDETATFAVSNLALRGGYAGFGAKDPGARDFEVYQTILTGYLKDFSATDHLITVTNTAATVEGLKLEGGGHLITATNSTLTLQALEMTGGNPGGDGFPDPSEYGGAMHCTGSELTISFCIFDGNSAYSGGAGFLLNCSTTIDHCQFINNNATWIPTPPLSGGGALRVHGGQFIATNSEFIKNETNGYSGGAVRCWDVHSFHRCSFIENLAEDYGGAAEGGQYFDCEFIGNIAYWGGALVGGELVVDCLFQQNKAQREGGAIHGKPTIINSKFTQNEIIWGGGGAIWGGVTAINCEFLNNSMPYSPDGGGGAVVACNPTTGPQHCGPATYVNCVFTGNHTLGSGGAALVHGNQTASFINCTFANNEAIDGSGAVEVHGTATVRNCIMWNNSPNEMDDKCLEIWCGPALINAQYSCIQGGWPGKGNFESDPMFVDPLGPDAIAGTADDDLRLATGSPCIDVGDNTALPLDMFDLDGNGNTNQLLPIDAAGGLRLVNDPTTPNAGLPLDAPAVVDIGAIEFSDFNPIAGDADGNGIINVDDLLAVINAWGQCDNTQNCPADLDASGNVGVSDLNLVVSNWSG